MLNDQFTSCYCQLIRDCHQLCFACTESSYWVGKIKVHNAYLYLKCICRYLFQISLPWFKAVLYNTDSVAGFIAYWLV